MRALVTELKRGRLAAGFVAAIDLCAEVLAARFPASPADNPNELPDAVVILPRA
jgi:putative membrane protein